MLEAVAPPLAHRARQAMALLPWCPVVVGIAYLVLFIARLPRLIDHVYWDSDAATAPVIAETFGSGTVILERFGWFTALWFELAVKQLPFHEQLWEVAPFLFSLASAGLLAWASWQLAGRWAAAMTATVAVATSPFVSYDLVTINFHTATWVATVVLAVYCLWLTSQSKLGGRVAIVAVLITLLAGTTLASDLLFLIVGLLPFALAGAVLLTFPRHRAAGVVVVASASLAGLIAVVTGWAMDRAGVEVFPVPTRFAGQNDLWPDVGWLLKGIVQLGNGDYFLDAHLTTRSTLSFACAVLMLVAVAAPFWLVRRQVKSGTRSPALLVYSSFWACSVGLTCATFVLSSEGGERTFYLIPVLYAIAATVPLAFVGRRGQLAVSAGITVVATASLVNLADARTAMSRTLPPVAAVSDRIVEIANKESAYRGYADYWDASSLSWSEDMAVHVIPVTQCSLPKTDLCPFYFNLNTDWYRPRANINTFVLRDSTSQGVRQELPETLAPYATYKVSDVITMYLFSYDVASRFVGAP